MHNKLRIVLSGALLASILMFTISLASSMSPALSTSNTVFAKSTNAHVVTVPQQRGDENYRRGYRDGYNAAVTDCQSNRQRPRAFAAPNNPYDQGFRDGYNYARANDRACKQQPSQTYSQGYRDGYNAAVTDCQSNRQRPRAFAAPNNPYDQGFTDGYNYARANDPACRGR